MLPVFYASRDGQAKRIAEQISVHLGRCNIEACARNSKTQPASAKDIESMPFFILIAAIRYGRHLKEAEQAMDAYMKASVKPPLALASVNLTARKPGKDGAENNPCLSKWIARRELEPELKAVFAGKLDYPKYLWWERLAMQMIMTVSGGETDSRATIEYTNWDAVSEWAAKIAERLARDEISG